MSNLDLFKKENLIDQYGIYPLLVVKNYSVLANQINKIHQNYSASKCIHKPMIRFFKYWIDNFNKDYALPNLTDYFSKIEANHNDLFLPNCDGQCCSKNYMSDEEEQNALIAAITYYMCLKQENIEFENLQQENKQMFMINLNNYLSEYLLKSFMSIEYNHEFHELFSRLVTNFPFKFLFSFHATSFIAYVTEIKKNGLNWNQINNDKYFHQKIDLNLNEINCNTNPFSSFKSDAIDLILKCHNFNQNNLEIGTLEINPLNISYTDTTSNNQPSVSKNNSNVSNFLETIPAQEINYSNISTNPFSITHSNNFPVTISSTGTTSTIIFIINANNTNDPTISRIDENTSNFMETIPAQEINNSNSIIHSNPLNVSSTHTTSNNQAGASPINDDSLPEILQTSSNILNNSQNLDQLNEDSNYSSQSESTKTIRSVSKAVNKPFKKRTR